MNRVKLISVWVLQILLAAMFALQGVIKISGAPGWVSRFKAWGYPDHFYLVIGTIELVGAVTLLIPRLAGFGSLLLIGVMVGATMTHLAHGEPQIVTTLVLTALLTLVVYLRRLNFTRLIRRT